MDSAPGRRRLAIGRIAGLDPPPMASPQIAMLVEMLRSAPPLDIGILAQRQAPRATGEALLHGQRGAEALDAYRTPVLRPVGRPPGAP
jgi:hypothetical protein